MQTIETDIIPEFPGKISSVQNTHFTGGEAAPHALFVDERHFFGWALFGDEPRISHKTGKADQGLRSGTVNKTGWF